MKKQVKNKVEQKNPLLFPLLTILMAAIMYCIAFHSERDKNKELQETILILKKTK